VAEITASRIGDVLRAQLESYQASVDVREVGTVIQIGDGIARVEGLRGAMAGELLEFVAGDGEVVYGMALNSMRTRCGAVLLGGTSLIKENDSVRTTGRIVEVPSGAGMLGRVVDPLGQPIDGKGPSPLRATAPSSSARWRHRAQGRAPTGPDRPHGHRRDDPDRSWPA